MAAKDSHQEFLAVAIDAAKKAGDVIRKGFYQTKHVEHKGLVDLVTETDKACEDLIFNHLKEHFPNHKLIGEETTAAYGVTELTHEPTWIVDPLDGTTNFVHGFPFVCVSIGLTIEKVPVVGVVYNPIMDELFTGIHGKGAFLNGNPIKVSSQSELVKSLLCTEHVKLWVQVSPNDLISETHHAYNVGTEAVEQRSSAAYVREITYIARQWGYHAAADVFKSTPKQAGTKRDKPTVDATTDRINSLLFKVRSLRMCGSCALDLCGIACGRLDLFYELGFGGPWDVAGGAVIVKEAGGVLFDPSGKEFDITAQRVAASNPLLKDAFVEALRESE